MKRRCWSGVAAKKHIRLAHERNETEFRVLLRAAHDAAVRNSLLRARKQRLSTAVKRKHTISALRSLFSAISSALSTVSFFCANLFRCLDRTAQRLKHSQRVCGQLTWLAIRAMISSLFHTESMNTNAIKGH